MRRTTGVACAAAALVLAARGRGADDPWTDERRLQPFGEREVGFHVDARDLATAPAPADATRARRWEAAREQGLDALVLHPPERRGAYHDRGAVHLALAQRRQALSQR